MDKEQLEIRFKKCIVIDCLQLSIFCLCHIGVLYPS